MQQLKFLLALFTAISMVILLLAPSTSRAQLTIIPNYWDNNVRTVKPEGLKIKRLRFLTTTDFPPFNFIDRNKRLSGFHIDLARQICGELEILRLCQIQALPWNELDAAIKKGEGEAIIAGLQMSERTKQLYDFSQPFLQVPARFVALKKSTLTTPMVRSLFQKKTGLVSSSSHARYFKEIFSNRKFIEFASLPEAKKALLDGDVEALFSDAVSMAFWLPSKSAANCCKFVGGPYLSQRYFGNGLSIAFPRGNREMVDAMNYALRRISENGSFRELYLRYFPVGLY